MSVQIPGLTGSVYVYEPFRINATWNDIGGNYIFAKQQGQDSWLLLYAGQCDSFRNRVPPHERWAEASRYGATHVLAHVNQNESLRMLEERDIIRRYQPPMNVQHRAA